MQYMFKLGEKKAKYMVIYFRKARWDIYHIPCMSHPHFVLGGRDILVLLLGELTEDFRFQ